MCYSEINSNQNKTTLTFASLFAADGFGIIPVVTLFAIVAVPTRGVVTTSDANRSTSLTRHLVKFQAESTLPRVSITMTCCQRGILFSLALKQIQCQ